jgi:hypothetical protein
MAIPLPTSRNRLPDTIPARAQLPVPIGYAATGSGGINLALTYRLYMIAGGRGRRLQPPLLVNYNEAEKGRIWAFLTFRGRRLFAILPRHIHRNPEGFGGNPTAWKEDAGLITLDLEQMAGRRLSSTACTGNGNSSGKSMWRLTILVQRFGISALSRMRQWFFSSRIPGRSFSILKSIAAIFGNTGSSTKSQATQHMPCPLSIRNSSKRPPLPSLSFVPRPNWQQRSNAGLRRYCKTDSCGILVTSFSLPVSIQQQQAQTRSFFPRSGSRRLTPPKPRSLCLRKRRNRH